MEIKMLATDLDGTLLPTGSRVPEENIAAVQRAVKAGVVVTIATGRMFRAALPVAEAIGASVPIITYNGALIKSVDGHVYAAHYLPEDVVRAALDFCRARGWYVQLYADDVLYFAEHTAESAGYEAEQQIKGETVGWDGLYAHTAHVAKLLSISSGAEETDVRIKELGAHLAGRADVVRSNPKYAEIVSHGVSKAAALTQLAGLLHIPMENVMAIGDSNNDLPMLRAAGHSVAMGNALPEVKEACEFLTGDCEKGGFAEAVEKFVLGA